MRACGWPGSTSRKAEDSAIRLILEYIGQWHAKHLGNFECHLQTGGIFSLLNGGNRLARHADALGKVTLCHLVGVKA